MAEDVRETLQLKGRSGRYGKSDVKWLSVRQLLRTTKEVVLAQVFAKFADQRVTMATADADLYSLTPATHTGPVRVDFAADTGDGFDATYTVARLLARGDMTSAAFSGPADLLVLGGDEVYPVASADNYRWRFAKVFEAAWRLWEGGSDAYRPTVLALPGNHDWYDGLTSFRRLFCESWAAVDAERDELGLVKIGRQESATTKAARDAAGGWHTAQSRSYFAVRVHPHWWVWGLDSQLDAPIDAAQLDYFRAAADHLGPEDGLVVCVATPSWMEAAGEEPPKFAEETPLYILERFLHVMLGVADTRVRLLLTGDKHHYVHYEPVPPTGLPPIDDVEWVEGPHLITCGGGGAFTSSTHHLDETLSVPWGRPDPPLPPTVPTTPREPRRATRYVKRVSSPSPAESRRMRKGIWVVGWRNGPIFPGLVAGLLLWVLLASVRPWTWPPGFAMAAPPVILTLALFGFASSGIRSAPGSKPVRRFALVAAATLGHLLGYVACLAVVQVVLDLEPDVVAVRWLSVVLLLLTLGPLVFGTYLWVCDRVGFHELESFSSMRSTSYKSLLRLQFDDDDLRVTVIGVRDVPAARSPDVRVSLTEPAITSSEIDGIVIARVGVRAVTLT